jgi:hypothetical protein
VIVAFSMLRLAVLCVVAMTATWAKTAFSLQNSDYGFCPLSNVPAMSSVIQSGVQYFEPKHFEGRSVTESCLEASWGATCCFPNATTAATNATSIFSAPYVGDDASTIVLPSGVMLNEVSSECRQAIARSLCEMCNPFQSRFATLNQDQTSTLSVCYDNAYELGAKCSSAKLSDKSLTVGNTYKGDSFAELVFTFPGMHVTMADRSDSTLCALSSPESSGLSAGAIAGAVLGALFGSVILLCCCCCLFTLVGFVVLIVVLVIIVLVVAVLIVGVSCLSGTAAFAGTVAKIMCSRRKQQRYNKSTSDDSNNGIDHDADTESDTELTMLQPQHSHPPSASAKPAVVNPTMVNPAVVNPAAENVVTESYFQVEKIPHQISNSLSVDDSNSDSDYSEEDSDDESENEPMFDEKSETPVLPDASGLPEKSDSYSDDIE